MGVAGRSSNREERAQQLVVKKMKARGCSAKPTSALREADPLKILYILVYGMDMTFHPL